MQDIYEPPFHMTEEITNPIVEIGEYVGSISALDSLRRNPVLRRENRIKTIYSSLAIEQNTLSLDQVSDVIEGKKVFGPPRDIREVKNAYEAYEYMSGKDPYDTNNLLYAHKLLMNGLISDAGMFRSGNVGVFAGTQLIHAGTPAGYIPEVMSGLMAWLRQSRYHPLVKSCIFHYVFEFIHPFSDGNGRTGRLWQSLILQRWNRIFAWLPVETLVHENQEEYYRVFQKADNQSDSTVFVQFMLSVIRDALKEVSVNQSTHSDVVTNVVTNEDKILSLLRENGHITAKDAARLLGISTRQVQRLLTDLKKRKEIIRHGASKNGYWEVV